MKIYKNLLILLVLTGFTFSCFDDNDDTTVSASEINDFVWKGMNLFYLYKDNIPDLANDRFSSDQAYADYLNSFASPEALFESLIYNRPTVDRFSWIVDDYIALEQLFSGVTKRSGFEFDLYSVPGSSSEVFGIVRLVLPNSNASNNNLVRGQVFTSVDGVTLTTDNYSSAFSPDSYTLGFADYDDNGTPSNLDDDSITSNGNTVTLTKEVYTENPVFKTETIDLGGGENLGYLMYNGFTADFNNQLNAAFGELKNNNVQHLVLDLRYNPGGSVNTATLLASMITGQFNNQVFTKLNYNSGLQSNNTTFDFTNTFDGNTINSLNLDKVYVLTTSGSASASEGVINGLKAYIDVVQIGTNTTGKSQASITIYDSPDFLRDGANPNHTYAMQPLVAITVNKNDDVVPSTGLTPSIVLAESPNNYGILGNVNEPLLAAAIADIQGTGRFDFSTNSEGPIATSNSLIPHINEMYIENKTLSDIQINKATQDQ